MNVHRSGWGAAPLAHRLDLPLVAVYDHVASTMDVAHRMAADGAPAGTLVLADAQSAGRGRGGTTWTSPPGSGIWLTLIERPRHSAPLGGSGALALRVGLSLARALDPFADAQVGIKWPNDLYVAGRKLAGILTEARWQEDSMLWVAIGAGINVSPPPGMEQATGLRAGVERLDVLQRIVPSLRAAAALTGLLAPDEMQEFANRDIAAGRPCLEPGVGHVAGIASTGELLIADSDGQVRPYRSGSLVFADAPITPRRSPLV